MGGNADSAVGTVESVLAGGGNYLRMGEPNGDTSLGMVTSNESFVSGLSWIGTWFHALASLMANPFLSDGSGHASLGRLECNIHGERWNAPQVTGSSRSLYGDSGAAGANLKLQKHVIHDNKAEECLLSTGPPGRKPAGPRAGRQRQATITTTAGWGSAQRRRSFLPHATA